MNSMHKLSDTRSRHGALTQQSRQRKINAWLQVAASLSEQITVELQTATEQLQGEGMADLQRVTALAQRLANNSKAMRDTLGTLFDSGEKSEEHAVKSMEDCTMDEQVNTLAKDMAGVKADIAVLKTDAGNLKLDLAVVRSNYATKSDVAEAKSAVILSCVGTMIALASVAFAVARLVH